MRDITTKRLMRYGNGCKCSPPRNGTSKLAFLFVNSYWLLHVSKNVYVMNQNKICFTRWTTLLHNYLRRRKPYPKQPISVISKLKLNIFSLRKWRSLYSNLYRVRLQLDWTRYIVIFFKILVYGSRNRWRTHQCQPWHYATSVPLATQLMIKRNTDGSFNV